MVLKGDKRLKSNSKASSKAFTILILTVSGLLLAEVIVIANALEFIFISDNP